MDNTDNRTDLPEGRAEQTRRAADEAQAQAAAGKQAKTGGMTRRTLCLGIGGGAVMLGLGGLKVANPQAIIRPPGGQDEDRLISACIRCEKCYEICPRDVIRPAHIEDGILNMRTPTFDFSDGYCDWCTEENGGTPLCVSACPTRAGAAGGRHEGEHHHRQSRHQHRLVPSIQADRLPILLRRVPVRGHNA